MVANLFSYILKNPIGNAKLGTNNLLPAALTTLSNVLSTGNNQTQYELYKQQAAEYVNTAQENAKSIRARGEVELRNLRMRAEMERGTDISTVGARGGNMSGSNLEVLMQKDKVRKLNQAVVRGSYEEQALVELRNGYTRASNVYRTLYAKAEADKWAARAGILKGIEAYVAGTISDAKAISKLQLEADLGKAELAAKRDYAQAYIGTSDIKITAPTTDQSDKFAAAVMDINTATPKPHKDESISLFNSTDFSQQDVFTSGISKESYYSSSDSTPIQFTLGGQ